MCYVEIMRIIYVAQASEFHSSNEAQIYEEMQQRRKTPRVKLLEVQKYGEADNSFVAVLRVIAGEVDIEDIRFYLNSDSKTIPLQVAGLVAQDSVDILVPISAHDPLSIWPKITSWQWVR